MITLRPEHEELVDEALRTGAYAGPDDVIGRALENLRRDEQWLTANRELIQGKIEAGWAQSERGEFLTAAESRADMARRKADWLAARQG